MRVLLSNKGDYSCCFVISAKKIRPACFWQKKIEAKTFFFLKSIGFKVSLIQIQPLRMEGKIWLGFSDHKFTTYQQKYMGGKIIEIEHHFATLIRALEYMNESRVLDKNSCQCCNQSRSVRIDSKWDCYYCHESNTTIVKCGCQKGNFAAKTHSIPWGKFIDYQKRRPWWWPAEV